MAISTGILDNFNRADGGLGGNWATIVPGLGVQPLAIVSNQAAPSAGTVCAMYWSATSFAADQEVHVTLAVEPGNNNSIALGARLLGPATQAGYDGYDLLYTRLSGTDTLEVRRVTDATATVLATINQDLAAGDRFGMRLVGSLITVYVDTGSGWTSVGSVSDATYASQAGYVALATVGTTGARLDDFGGGVVVPAITVGAGLGTLIVVGQQATIDAPVTVPAQTGVLAAEGLAATVDARTTIAAGPGVLSAEGLAAAVDAPIVVAAAAGSLSAEGLAATVDARTTIAAGPGILNAEGLAATVDGGGVVVQAQAGALSAEGLAATVDARTTIAAGPGILNAEGLAAMVDGGGVVVQAQAGALSAEGLAATVDAPIVVEVEAGSLSAEGLAATVDARTTIAAGPGVLSVEGLAAHVSGSPVEGLVTLTLQQRDFDLAARARDPRLAARARKFGLTLSRR